MPHPTRYCKNALLLTLLFTVVWGRAWAGVPQTMEHNHAHGDEQHGQVVQTRNCGDDIRLNVHTDHNDVVATSSQHTSAAIAPADDEHHHHLHLCDLGGQAITSCPDIPVATLKPVWHATFSPMNYTRRHERLLRPPQA